MALALLLVASALLLLEIPAPPTLAVDSAIVFELLPESEREPTELEREELVETILPPEVTAPEAIVEEASRTHEQEELAESTDWYESLDRVVQETVDSASQIDSLHPAFDEKRRQAAIKFRPSRAPYEKKVWENVETDQLGRKILVSGNCSRVLDDPSAINYDMQREFTQYLVSCSYQKSPPRELPWVDGIRDNYAYLSNPDGRSYE